MALVHSEKSLEMEIMASQRFFLNKLFFGKQYIYHEYTRYTSMLIGFYQTVPQWVISSIRMIEVFADLRISERCSRICSDDQ